MASEKQTVVLADTEAFAVNHPSNADLFAFNNPAALASAATVTISATSQVILSAMMPAASNFVVDLPSGIHIPSTAVMGLPAGTDSTVNQGTGELGGNGGFVIENTGTSEIMHTGKLKVQGVLVTSLSGAVRNVKIYDALSAVAADAVLRFRTAATKSYWMPFYSPLEINTGLYIETAANIKTYIYVA